MYTPLKTFICPFVFPIGELYYEVSDDLSLDYGAQAVLNDKLTQLYPP